jgi:hypothetical protein
LLGAAPQARQALVGEDLGHPSAIERRALSGHRGGDLIDGVPSRAQLNDPGTCRLLGRCHLRAGSGGDEEVPPAGAEVPHGRVQRLGGEAVAGGGLGGWQALDQVGPERLVAPVGGLGGLGEELPAGAGRVLGCYR